MKNIDIIIFILSKQYGVQKEIYRKCVLEMAKTESYIFLEEPKIVLNIRLYSAEDIMSELENRIRKNYVMSHKYMHREENENYARGHREVEHREEC